MVNYIQPYFLQNGCSNYASLCSTLKVAPLHLCQHLNMTLSSIFAHLCDLKYLIVTLICISLITSKADCFVIHLLANQISPLEVTYVSPFPIFPLFLIADFFLNSR